MHENLLEYVPQDGAFQNRVILVTGAAAGIGRAISLAYARFGATVVLLDKNVPALEAVYDEITEAGYPEPAIYPMDLQGAMLSDYEKLAENIKEQLGGLDGLVLNAASLQAFMPIKQHDADLWAKMITTNLHANFMLVRSCLPLLDESDDAAIVFSSDISNKAYYGAYGVSKAAMDGFCAILADEHDDKNHFIRVNRINTGPVRTSMRRLHFPGEAPESVARPEAIVGPYLYYLGADAGTRTGEALELGRLPADQQWPGELANQAE